MRYVWIAIVVVVLGALALIAMPKAARTGAPSGPSVTIGTTTFSIEVADTEAARELGLGQRDSLAAGHGMLFVFDAPGNWGFWMKDTRFPLDMIWTRADGTIISIARNVATSTYAQNPPQVFYPSEPDASYVLEVNAGAAADFAPGQKMIINS